VKPVILAIAPDPQLRAALGVFAAGDIRHGSIKRVAAASLVGLHLARLTTR